MYSITSSPWGQSSSITYIWLLKHQYYNLTVKCTVSFDQKYFTSIFCHGPLFLHKLKERIFYHIIWLHPVVRYFMIFSYCFSYVNYQQFSPTNLFCILIDEKVLKHRLQWMTSNFHFVIDLQSFYFKISLLPRRFLQKIPELTNYLISKFN